MSWISVDVEADGPIPGDYSMISFGAVVVEPGLERTFYAELKPVSDRFVPEALRVSGLTREQTLAFEDAASVMGRFDEWLASVGGKRPQLISDNNGFDWQFINWYFHHFLGRNPFGHTSTNLGSLYKGMQKDMFTSFKHLRQTAHTHNALDDARGNAEALLTLKTEHGLKIGL
jgi:DNA polymerase III epsilon subunit-like protein